MCQVSSWVVKRPAREVKCCRIAFDPLGAARLQFHLGRPRGVLSQEGWIVAVRAW